VAKRWRARQAAPADSALSRQYCEARTTQGIIHAALMCSGGVGAWQCRQQCAVRPREVLNTGRCGKTAARLRRASMSSAAC